jgi:RNA polymerase sigma-70 factor (ECF subfamily)
VRLQCMNGDAVAVEIETTGVQPRVAAHALEEIYRAHRDPVFRYLRSICRDEDRALDLTAVTFERAFAELRAGREPGLGWLLRTARNAAIDAERRARAARLLPRRSHESEAAAPSPEDAALDAESAASVLRALAQLPHPQRDAIALRYSTELTVREIAGVIGKSQSAMQKLLDRGLARLKEMLHDLA